MRACGESAGKLTEPILGAIQGAHTGSHWSAAASSAPHSQSGGGARGGPAYPVAISLGNDGAAIFLMPSRNLAVITLGRTVAGSERCPVFVEDVHDGTASGGNGNENGRGTSSLGMFGGVNGNAAGMGEDPAGDAGMTRRCCACCGAPSRRRCRREAPTWASTRPTQRPASAARATSSRW